jgi:threonyl-tRNA synthetase
MTTAMYSGEHMLEANAEPLRPVMIHRALLGSIERFTAVATEHFAGKW